MQKTAKNKKSPFSSCLTFVFSFLFYVLGTSSASSQAVALWKTVLLGGGESFHATAHGACIAQRDSFNPNAPLGGTSFPKFNHADCHWCATQQGCEEASNTILDGTVALDCYVDGELASLTEYVLVPPGYCMPVNQVMPSPPLPPCNTTCEQQQNGNVMSYCLPNHTASNPVVIASGAKIESVTDFSTQDGLLKIQRFYSSMIIPHDASRLPYLPNNTGFGRGWVNNAKWNLVLPDLFEYDPYIILQTPDAVIYKLELLADGSFAPDDSYNITGTHMSGRLISPTNYTGSKDDNEAILKNGGEIEITDQHGRKITFELYAEDIAYEDEDEYLNGRVTEIVIPSGYTQDYAYDNAGNLTSISDSFNRSISFEWVMSTNIGSSEDYNVISKITLPNGNMIDYDYADVSNVPLTSRIAVVIATQRLEKVTTSTADGTVLDSTTYHYENADFPYSLTGITDHQGVRVGSYTYNDRGRVTSSGHSNGDSNYQFSYEFPDYDKQITTVTNPLGKQTAYHFEQNYHNGALLLTNIEGNATAHCPATTAELEWEYDYSTSKFWLERKTDAAGRTTEFERDIKHRPTRIVQGSGDDESVTEVEWSDVNSKPTQIRTEQLTTDYGYTDAGALIQITQTDTTSHNKPYSTNGLSRSWQFSYNAQGRVTSIDGPASGTNDLVVYTYDSAGNVQTITDEVGLVTTVHATNALGQVTSVSDPNGVVTNMTYDSLGRLTQVSVDPSDLNAVYSVTYDSLGQVIKITEPNGNYYDYDYSASRRLLSVTDANGAKINYSYDLMGNITKMAINESNGNLQYELNYLYDELGRLLKSIGVSNREWAYAYNNADEVTQVTDPRGESWTYAYDSLGRLVTSQSPMAETVTRSYDEDHNLTAYEDPRNIVTEFVHNGFGEVIQEYSPDTGSMVYVRNVQGWITEKTDGRGKVTQYTYDNAGRLRKILFPTDSSQNITLNYDQNNRGAGEGRLTRVVDQLGKTIFYYDALGRITRELRVINGTKYNLYYSYDASGNIDTITYPSGRQVAYIRDAQGLVTETRSRASSNDAWQVIIQSARYLPFGPRTYMEYGNGLIERRSYDQNYNLTNLEVSSNNIVDDKLNLNFTYGDGLNITEVDDQLSGARSCTYSYDGSNRLVNYSGLGGDISYSYDGSGNRLSRHVAGETAVSSSFESGTNRLSSLSDGRSFAYDGSGNMVQDTSSAQDVSYSYNDAGRLSTVSIDGVVTGSYIYNAWNQLIQKTAMGSTTHYIHDLDGNVLAEIDSSGQTQTEYIWMEYRSTKTASQATGATVPLAMISDIDTVTPKLSYIHTDHQNKQIILTDENRGTVRQVVSTPFGVLASTSGDVGLNTKAGFAGQWTMPEAGESGLAYNWHRHYDPSLGRYTQPDPLGLIDGPSRYAYAGNNPVRYEDPRGERKITSTYVLHVAYGIGMNPCGNYFLGVAASFPPTTYIMPFSFIVPAVLNATGAL